MSNTQRIKCVAIGDGFVGKTSLLLSLCKKQKEEAYTPTIFDNYLLTLSHGGQVYEIILIDTAGQEEFLMLRQQSYDGTDVFIICFDISNTSSFINVKEVWLPEIEAYSNAAKLLVGTKKDLRNDPETIDNLNADNKIFVTNDAAKKFAESHNMIYRECSSKTQDNIQNVGTTIVEAHSESRKEKSAAFSLCKCANPLLLFARKALCCRNNY